MKSYEFDVILKDLAEIADDDAVTYAESPSSNTPRQYSGTPR